MKKGSSPLTRGKRASGVVAATGRGLIPAHAGKTWPPPSQSGTCRAHPRSRGENLFLMPASAARSGSSPLTRGKLP